MKKPTLKEDINRMRSIMGLNESQFTIGSLDNNELNDIYNVFKSSYEASTGTSWDLDKFVSRSHNWVFFGDKNGYIALRPQKSGLYKLVGVAGSPKSILYALDEIQSTDYPVWGMVSKNIQSQLMKKGFKTPTPEQLQALYKSIPPEVFGGVDTIQNPDGSLTLKYADVGDATKYFVGNDKYFEIMKQMFGDKFTDV